MADNIVGPILVDASNVAGLIDTIIPQLQATTAQVQTNLTAEVNARLAAGVTAAAALVTAAGVAAAATTVVSGDLVQEITDREAAITTVTGLVTDEVTRAEAAEVALGIRVDSLLSNTDAVALDSLAKVVTAFQAVDGDLHQAILDLAAADTSALGLETIRATAAEVANANALTAAVSTINGNATTAATTTAANLAAAVTALHTYADNAATQGGSRSAIEDLVVSNNRIVLTHAPKDGWFSVSLGQVEYRNGVVAVHYDCNNDATVTDGKTYQISVANSGDLDGKQVRIQYLYVAA